LCSIQKIQYFWPVSAEGWKTENKKLVQVSPEKHSVDLRRITVRRWKRVVKFVQENFM